MEGTNTIIPMMVTMPMATNDPRTISPKPNVAPWKGVLWCFKKSKDRKLDCLRDERATRRFLDFI